MDSVGILSILVLIYIFFISVFSMNTFECMNRVSDVAEDYRNPKKISFPVSKFHNSPGTSRDERPSFYSDAPALPVSHGESFSPGVTPTRGMDMNGERLNNEGMIHGKALKLKQKWYQMIWSWLTRSYLNFWQHITWLSHKLRGSKEGELVEVERNPKIAQSPVCPSQVQEQRPSKQFGHQDATDRLYRVNRNDNRPSGPSQSSVSWSRDDPPSMSQAFMTGENDESSRRKDWRFGKNSPPGNGERLPIRRARTYQKDISINHESLGDQVWNQRPPSITIIDELRPPRDPIVSNVEVPVIASEKPQVVAAPASPISNILPISDTESPECGICLDELSTLDEKLKKKVIELHCHPTHHFHMDCVREWFKTSATCPNCRNENKIAEQVEALLREHSHVEDIVAN
ncbi:hypothetical protein CROQUDRAFT_96648 [Cronartium quercuum f. sp. fusiforme G11]|uniref:RING-type domain-containing protein n=1 Tax=Cronartium quercuum f. sp. fusiforme G11 TaxID=708437 RepID=A0A9P6NAT6_9BASI|nr:hypothetical protein CROQUDRAFT_96648 [Cronartium quercuum f. sp. fusiforme G11]